MEELILLSWFW